ncbi:MAG: glycosyltransferase, partial [Armatimonadetes bacterium]|nr:glycosyltransferase [Armatimonadota bacterium]
MRILVASKFWYRRGGLERVMFDEIRWLEESGHEIAHFSTRHPQNVESPWADYFAPYLELGVNSNLSVLQKTTAVARMFWNREAGNRLGRLIEDFRPDVVHIHGVHRQLSPSVVRAAYNRGVPVVQTLHDYHPVCPSDTLLRAGSHVCDPPLCGRSRTSPCARYRCVRSNLAVSVVCAVEARTRTKTMAYGRCVNRLISPSRFLADLVVRQGLTRPTIDVVRNAIPISAPGHVGDYFLFAGRLSPEKGVGTLIDAAREAGVQLVIAGDGPLMTELVNTRSPGVRLVGHLDGNGVDDLLRDCLAAVVPSEWYENAPMSVLEAMAAGKAVIASRIGG